MLFQRLSPPRTPLRRIEEMPPAGTKSPLCLQRQKFDLKSQPVRNNFSIQQKAPRGDQPDRGFDPLCSAIHSKPRRGRSPRGCLSVPFDSEKNHKNKKKRSVALPPNPHFLLCQKEAKSNIFKMRGRQKKTAGSGRFSGSRSLHRNNVHLPLFR